MADKLDDIKLEQRVLGMCITYPRSMPVAAGILKGDSFYQQKYRKLWDVLLEMFEEGITIELETVASYLKKRNLLSHVGGYAELVEQQSKLTGDANVEYFCFQLEELAIRRRTIDACTRTIKSMGRLDRDVLLTSQDHQDAIDASGYRVNAQSVVAGQRIDATHDLIRRKLNKEGISGIPTGIEGLDKMLGGFQQSQLVILAGRPGNFKTGLMINFAYGAAAAGYKPIVFQLEMDAEQIGARELAMHSKMTTHDLTRGNMDAYDESDVLQAKEQIRQANVFTDVDPLLDSVILRSKLIRYRNQFGVDICFIDYLQLMEMGSARGKNYSQQVAETSRKIKVLAKELKIPIVVLSQLNRSVESRNPPIPQLSDLRDSGAIEQDADIVLFTYVPQKYEDEPTDEEGRSLKGMLMCIVSKHRQGETGERYLGLDMSHNKVWDINSVDGMVAANQGANDWSDYRDPTGDYNEDDNF